MTRTLRILAAGGLCTAVLLSLAGWKRGAGAQQDGEIDKLPLGEEIPGAGPAVVFPDQFLTDDEVLNKFIRDALGVCANGDYDGFRALFGVTHRPMGEAQFKQVWQGVKRVSIAGIYPDPRKTPAEYYVHVIIQLRKPDRRDKTEKQGVVWVFREDNAWKIDQAPRDIASKIIRYASTQPGAGIPATTRPAGQRAAATRPSATAPSVSQ